MASFTITTTPMPIYPDGRNETVALTNNGPWTIYLDSDTSVSDGNSYPLPPSATMTWQAGRPLFAVLRDAVTEILPNQPIVGPTVEQRSTLVMTRNTDAVDANRSSTSDLLQTRATQLTDTAQNFDSFVETSAYNTLYIAMLTSHDGASPTGGDNPSTLHRFTVSWWSSDGSYLGSDRFQAFSTRNAYRSGTVITVPVKGAYASVNCAASPNAVFPFTITIRLSGTSRVLPFTIDWLKGDPFLDATETGVTAYSLAARNTGIFVNPPAGPIYLNGVHNGTIHVSIYSGGAYSAGGNFAVYDASTISSTNIVYDVMPIAARGAGPVFDQATLHAPIDRPCQVGWYAAVPVATGPVVVTIQLNT